MKATSRIKVKDPFMATAIALFLFGVLCITALIIPGCATTGPQTQEALIGIAAKNVGYGVYRAVPDSRPILGTACLIKDFTDPAQAAALLREQIGKVWEEADKLTDTDARIAVSTINDLVELLDAQIADEKDVARARALLSTVVGKLCEGVAQASK